jgi:murein L,D-transpeptidase YcbB/YkuD
MILLAAPFAILPLLAGPAIGQERPVLARAFETASPNSSLIESALRPFEAAVPRAAEIGARDGTMASAPLPKSYAIVAHRAAPQMPVSARGTLAVAAPVTSGKLATQALARPGVRDAAPDITGSLPKQTAVSSVDEAGIDAAVVPDIPPDPLVQAAVPPTETPGAPIVDPAVTPSSKTAAPSGTPPVGVAPPPVAAAPQKPLTIADRLHAALDVWVAADVKGRDAAETARLRSEIAAFYITRNFAPLWVETGKPNAAARSVLARLAHARDDGLTIDDMPPVVFGEADGDANLIEAELNLTDLVVAYARQASGSRIEPIRIATSIGAKPVLPDVAAILGSVGPAGANAGTVLEGFNPPQAGYRALRDKLGELRREAKSVARQPIPAGPVLKVGMSDPRVPLIRARFGLDGDADASDSELLYDTRIAAAVAQFQKESGLPASGALTVRTIAALSGGEPEKLEDVLLANMEMWRWMPRDLGKDRIEVNIPDFSVSVFRGEQLATHNKVVVGNPKTPTPVFSNVMRFLIVNPYWNVPPSIIRKEMLPRLARDPGYLARMGYEVFTRHGHLVVRQPPGERNALGRIKFMFPNDYAVYLHDTPSRALFGASQRAFSHGCVRVDQPFDFAIAVMGAKNGWSEQRLKKLIGGDQRYVNLPEALPIHIEYFTAFVDADGHLQLRNDVYGYAHKVDVALGLEKDEPERQKREHF